MERFFIRNHIKSRQKFKGNCVEKLFKRDSNNPCKEKATSGFANEGDT